jgi:prepilin-type N-terminal cleavage/methylation domain-containing protein
MRAVIMKNKKGFTLSETLLALAIVGVIASITIPQLINKVNENAFETLEKKARETLTEALDLYMTDLDLPKIKPSDMATSTARQNFLTTYMRTQSIINLSDYSTTYKNSGGTTTYNFGGMMNDYDCVRTKDGIMICISYMVTGNNTEPRGYAMFDLNGPSAGPNMVGQDLITNYTYDTTGRVYKN